MPVNQSPIKPKLLLHVCCAPCSGFLHQSLKDCYEITVFYDNSNIDPLEEYVKRRDEAKKYFTDEGIGFIEKPYNHERWKTLAVGLEQELERGRRCKRCYYARLASVAEYAQTHGYAFFATSLSISPHKDAKIINNLGRALAHRYSLHFLAEDWKIDDGYKKATIFANQRGFYRQKYCGCEFSFRGGKKNE